jgi:hypothetical protein
LKKIERPEYRLTGVEELNNAKIYGNLLWSKIKTKIFEMDSEMLEQLSRHNKLRLPSENYLTKLDLIDKYPELFDRRKN